MTKAYTCTKQELIDMKEAISYSRLSAFSSIWRNEPKPYSPSYDMELGKFFEAIVRDGFDDGYDVNSHYYYVDDSTPKKFIEAYLDNEDPQFLIRYTKKGEVYANDSKLSESINKHQQGKFPILLSDWELILKLYDELIELEVMGLKVSYFLDGAEFDINLVWEMGGVKKKTQIDIISTVDVDGQKILVNLDLKLAASKYTFKSMYQSKYWIQERHATEGVHEYAKVKGYRAYDGVIYLVGYRDTELVGEVQIDPDNLEYAEDKYINLVGKYQEWVDTGKESTGHIEKQLMRVW